MFRSKLQINYTHSGSFLSLEKESRGIPLEFGVFFFLINNGVTVFEINKYLKHG
jgi:hypothetical protein